MSHQYCRYCAHCFEGDCFYCNAKEKVLSREDIRRTNNCAEYVVSELGDVETGKQYVPRKRKHNDGAEQITILTNGKE